jgi:Domain of unknown function (DUF4136)
MNLRLSLLLLFVGWTAAGCQSIRVRSKYDHTVAFADLHTFCWVAPPAWLHNDPHLNMDVLEPLVQHGVESQLTAKGFRPSDCATADFDVSFRPALHDQFIDTPSLNGEQGGVTVYSYNPETGGRLWKSSSDTMLVDEREGSLVIEVRQPKSGRVIWKGVASANLNNPGSMAQRVQRVQTAVRMLMERFPPPASK